MDVVYSGSQIDDEPTRRFRHARDVSKPLDRMQQAAEIGRVIHVNRHTQTLEVSNELLKLAGRRDDNEVRLERYYLLEIRPLSVAHLFYCRGFRRIVAIGGNPNHAVAQA